ncbi:MAG: hypothetical protein ABH812_02915 [bacterium]
MKKREEKNIKKIVKILLQIIFFSVLLIYIAVNLYRSVIFQKNDRINLFIFDKNPTFLSISTKGEQNFLVNFYPDLKINVPGGFSFYRIGALNKLVQLEKRADIYQKAISGSTLTFLDYYFYPKKQEIYYGGDSKPQIVELSIKNVLFDKSNANFFDRLYLSYRIISLNKNDLIKLNTFERLNKNKDMVFDTERFEETYNGLFYQSTYRTERKSVQILYTKNYSSAVLIGKILENNGIRVVDISKTTKTYKGCVVIEKTNKLSKTAKNLNSYFGCKTIQADTGISDIIMFLGAIENSWLIN